MKKALETVKYPQNFNREDGYKYSETCLQLLSFTYILTCTNPFRRVASRLTPLSLLPLRNFRRYLIHHQDGGHDVAETLEQLQYTTRLNPENRSFV
jgi:hypothetical protein